MNLKNFILAIIIGSIILAVASVMTGVVGQKKGMSFALLAKDTFGNRFYYIAALIPPLCLIGWDSFNLSLMAHITTKLLNINSIYFLIVIFFTIWFMSTALFGFKGLAWISRIAVPIMIIILIFTGSSAIITKEFWTQFNIGDKTIGFNSGLIAIVGSFALGASVCSPDMQRYNKTSRQAMWTSILTFLVAFPFLIFFGGSTSIKTGESDLIEAFRVLNLLPIGIILVILLTWTTVDNDYYSASLGLSNIFKTKKWKMVLLSASIACFIAILGIQQYLEFWLLLMTAIAIPSAGVIFSDFLCTNYFYKNIQRKKDWRFSPFISWLIGFIFSLLSAKMDIGVPPINGILISIIFHILLFKIDKLKSRYLYAT